MFESIDSERFLDLYDYFESLKEDSQRRKLVEELIKFEWGVGNINDITYELADNFFLLFQHMYAYGIEPKEVYDALIEKMERTEQRKKDKYYEK